jgi:essential nuclear protein 1
MLALIIPLTNPDQWTPNSILAATRLFISSKSAVSEGFLTSILLERVREDIAETKKLNIHLYNSIKKALYKPKEFFRGFLFPLVSSGTCTLREAAIISSALSRVSIPVLHSAYALARLCEIAAEQMSINTEAGGATNVFLKTLLEKRYALPYQTIDALVFHFLRFRPTIHQPLPSQAEAMELDGGERRMNQQRWLPGRDMGIEGKLPVIWHQCLLAFAQRYRDEITEDQREALLDLLLVKGHKDIGPEVRRELLAGRGRGVVAIAPELEAVGAEMEVEGGDDTMMG